MELRDRLQDTLGNAYTLERELGGGGMSRVFVAEETAFERKVVVKVLPADKAGDVNAERFKREIQVAAKLQHAHIVPVLSAGEMSGIPYYTMPFVEGESLRGRLSRTGALSVQECISIARDVARALTYAHERGVVHRDIKPDNVMLSAGSAVVTDFGIAKAISDSRTTDAPMTLTQVGTSLGTPAYMSPEQAAADPATDHRTDLYAFGCMVYELLAGRPPFVEKTPQKLLAAHMGVAPEPVESLRPDTPPALAALVMRCLEKEAVKRPQSARDVAHALDSVTSTGDARTMPPILLGGPGMLKKALALYVAAFVVVAVLAKAAIVGIGLPSWVLPGSLIVMALGLPVILFTGYVHRVTHRALTMTPTFTPGGTPSMGMHGTMATLAVKASPHMSWRRTTIGGVVAVAAFIALIGAYMALRALGIGPAGSLLAAGRLDERAPVLIADFDVKGADTTLAEVVTEAVRANLAQSGAISIASPTSLAAALGRMQRDPASRIDLRLAREIAAREGIKAIVHGDVTSLGWSGFAISVRLIPADSGNDFTSFRTTVDGPKDLISAADQLSRDLRGKIGESLKAVQGSPPLEQVTTASLEALRKYSAGNRAADVETNYPKAIALLREAVAIDSGFAMAWRKLSVALFNGRFPQPLVDSAISTAMRHDARLSEYEKLMTRAFFYNNGPGRDRAKAIAAYEALLERGDSSAAVLNNLSIALSSRRQFARAESLLAVAIASPSPTAQAHNNLTIALINQGKLREAEANIELTRRRLPSIDEPSRVAVDLLYHRGELAAYERALDTMRQSKDLEARRWSAPRRAGAALLHGRLAEFAKLSTEARAQDSAAGLRLGPPDAAIAAQLDVWLRERPEQAVARLDSGAGRGGRGGRGGIPLQAIAGYALAGRPDRARAMLARRDSVVTDTALLRDQQPLVHAVLGQIALAEGRPRDAIVEFRKADMRPDGPFAACALPGLFSLGRAFDLANEPDSSIAHFEKYLSTPCQPRMVNATFDPLQLAGVLKRLAELYDAKGDRAKAMSYYARFIELWKDADPELRPKVEAARKRLAELQKQSG